MNFLSLEPMTRWPIRGIGPQIGTCASQYHFALNLKREFAFLISDLELDMAATLGLGKKLSLAVTSIRSCMNFWLGKCDFYGLFTQHLPDFLIQFLEVHYAFYIFSPCIYTSLPMYFYQFSNAFFTSCTMQLIQAYCSIFKE